MLKNTFMVIAATLMSGCFFKIPDPTEAEIAEAVKECPPLKATIKHHFDSQSKPELLSGLRFAVLVQECHKTPEYIKMKNQKILDIVTDH